MTTSRLIFEKIFEGECFSGAQRPRVNSYLFASVTSRCAHLVDKHFIAIFIYKKSGLVTIRFPLFAVRLVFILTESPAVYELWKMKKKCVLSSRMLVFVYFVFFLLCKILITIINLFCCILVSSREERFWVRFVVWFSLVWSAVRYVIHVTCFCFWTTISNGCYMFCVVFLLSQFCLEKFVTVKNLFDRTVPIWLDVRILINDGCLQLTRSRLLLPFYQYWWSSTESRVLML